MGLIKCQVIVMPSAKERCDKDAVKMTPYNKGFHITYRYFCEAHAIDSDVDIPLEDYVKAAVELKGDKEN